jgi:DNA mismatch repair protein MutS
MEKCALCGCNKCLETHHILFQCTADAKGMIKGANTLHKNQPFNLMVVCRDCHIRIHREDIQIKIEPLKISF